MFFLRGLEKRDFFSMKIASTNLPKSTPFSLFLMARSSSRSRSPVRHRDGRHHSDRPHAARDRGSRSPQASSVRYRRSSTRRSPDDFSTAVGLLRDATSLLAKKKGQPASDRPVSFRDFRSTLFYIYISQARTV